MRVKWSESGVIHGDVRSEKHVGKSWENETDINLGKGKEMTKAESSPPGTFDPLNTAGDGIK